MAHHPTLPVEAKQAAVSSFNMVLKGVKPARSCLRSEVDMVVITELVVDMGTETCNRRRLLSGYPENRSTSPPRVSGVIDLEDCAMPTPTEHSNQPPRRFWAAHQDFPIFCSGVQRLSPGSLGSQILTPLVLTPYLPSRNQSYNATATVNCTLVTQFRPPQPYILKQAPNPKTLFETLLMSPD